MRAPIDITTGQREMLLALLRRYIPGVAVWAYGSRVRFTARPNSDLDLVAFTTPAQHQRVSELKDELAESGLPFLVDLHVWDEVPERFRDIIRKEYAVVQDAAERDQSSGWPVLPLGELTENFDGRRVPVPESERKPGPFPYYGASGIVDRVDGHLFDGEYLLIAEDGENLRTRRTPVAFMATGKFWVNNHAHVVRGNHRADTRFLSYVLSQTDISGYLTGSTMPKLTQGNLNRLPVIAPPLPEQKAIAAILGSLDDKIELNRRMNATLEAMARALFQSWFVDFDPVRAKMDGRRSAGMDDATAALFPDSFQHSEAGYIPIGWRVGKLDELANFSRSSLNPSEFSDEIFDHYSLPAFDDGRTPRAEPGSTIKSNKLMVTRDAVLLSKLNPHIPRIWLPDLHPSRRSVCSTEFIVASTRSGVSREFLFSLFTSSAFASMYGTLVTGTTGSHQRVRPESVLEIKTVVPPSCLIRSFTLLTRSMFEQISRDTAQSRTLATLRDTLLPKLLSGELSVAEDSRVQLDLARRP